MSLKITRPDLPRRSALAVLAGLAAAAAAGNYGRAEVDTDDLPDAADALSRTMPTPAPNLAFTDAAGAKLTLANYRGSGLLVNIWATWCGPCVAEFPTIAAIAPDLARGRILVLPISIDFEGLRAVQPFYARNNIKTLPILLDPDGSAPDALNAPGIPATVIINPAGQLVAQLVGTANWNTPRTLRLLHSLIGTTPPHNGIEPV